jgi:hypothetical protein
MSPYTLILLVLFAAPDVELCPNGGFEEGDKSPAHWDRPDGLTTFWEKDEKRGGKCIRIDSRVSNEDYHRRLDEMKLPEPPPARTTKDPSKTGYGAVGGNDGVPYWSDFIEVKPGVRYRLSVDCRSQGGKPKVFLKGYAEIPAEIEEDGKAKKTLLRRMVSKISLDAEGGLEWKRTSVEFCPSRERKDVRWVRIMLYAYWPAQTYWFDEVSLVEVGPDADAPRRWAKNEARAEHDATRETEARRGEARAVLAHLRKAIDRFKSDTLGLPASLDALAKASYVAEVGEDPWGHAYVYERTEKGYALRSLGPDGKEGGGDDVE